MKKDRKILLAGGCCLLCVGLVILALVLLSRRQGGEADLEGAILEADASVEAAAEPTPEGEAVFSAVSAMDVMCSPNGIADMGDDTILITDIYHKRLWQVEERASEPYAGGDTVIGLYGEPLGGYHDGALLDSHFRQPWDTAKFLDGWAVSDTENNAVRIVRRQKVQTLNGETEESLTITDIGVAFERPTGLASDGEGNLYVADTGNGAIRKIDPKGAVTTVVEGLEEPMGLCMEGNVLYIAEAGANRIMKVEDGALSVVAGSGEEGLEDGPAQQAAFAAPQGITMGADGVIYVADTLNSAIRLIKDGQVETVAVRDIALTDFGLVRPTGLLAKEDRLYICDSFARKVFMLEWKED